MEGLVIAEALAPLRARLPVERLSWRFPDAQTFVLPLAAGTLWLYLKPPNPRLGIESGYPSAGNSASGFQALLASRAVGPLLEAEQDKLDRVVSFYFGADEGFVKRPPVRLVAELTGRNANLTLLDEAGLVLGVMREVTSSVNRFRELRPGLPYTPPPPYHKLDPRAATDADLAAALRGAKLGDIRSLLDGVGPELTRALAARLELAPGAPVDEARLAHTVAVLRELAAAPRAFLEAHGETVSLRALREDERGQALRAQLEEALKRAARKAERRLADVGEAQAAASAAGALRARGDLLMAYANRVPGGAETVSLTDFEGQEVTLALDPKLSAVQNAQALYRKAKRREAALERALAEAPRLESELAELQERLAELPLLTPKELGALAERHLPKAKGQPRRRLGVRYTSPHGFLVLVGRNARENDLLTMKTAKSLDLWLHVQGYHGSHVIVQTNGSELPYETVLFAAELAAAFSQAADSSNVAVDYTLRKHLWKPKGAAMGAVHYSRQKTVYVTPDKHKGHGEAELAAEPG
jgi:predicted ribosome quality control (RQC) complex YloA/Tae2 family protein